MRGIVDWKGKEGIAYALLDGTVGLDIDNIADLVDFHVRSQSDHTLSKNPSVSIVSLLIQSTTSLVSHLLAVITAERIARSSAETGSVTHCE